MLYVVPSRGRPANVATLINEFRNTRTVAKLRIALDDDDPTLDDYMEVLGRQNIQRTDWLSCAVFKRRSQVDGMVYTLNTAVARYAEDEDAIGFMGDDHLPRTVGWDAELLKEIQSGSLITYGNDLFQSGNLPTAVLLDGRIPKTLGYTAPPALHHLYVDNVWKLWGTRSRRMSYRDDIIIEHMHPVIYKSATDERYAAVNSSAVWEHDEKAYHAYIANDMDVDLAKLSTL